MTTAEALAHRSKQARESLDHADGEIEKAFLPPHSPQLNPVQ
jgi:transposase